MRTRRSPQYGHVSGRQAHEVVFILRRKVEQATEWQIPIFVMDGDVAAAFDHGSENTGGPKHSSSWATSRHQEFVAHDLCHKVRLCIGYSVNSIL